MQCKALVAQEYAGRQLQAGDPFDVEPQHVPLLLALGRIESEEGQHPGEYLTREMSAKRPYRRKAGTQ